MILISDIDGLTASGEVLKKGDFFRTSEHLEREIEALTSDEFLKRHHSRKPDKEELIFGFVYSGQIFWRDLSKDQKEIINDEIKKRRAEVQKFLDSFKRKK